MPRLIIFLMRSGLAGVKDGAVFERLVFSKTGYDTRREFGALRRGFQPGILVRDQPDSSLRARPVLPEMVGHEPDRTQVPGLARDMGARVTVHEEVIRNHMTGVPAECDMILGRQRAQERGHRPGVAA